MVRKNKKTDESVQLRDAFVREDGAVIFERGARGKIEKKSSQSSSEDGDEIDDMMTQSLELPAYDFTCYGCSAYQRGRAYLCEVTGCLFGTCCANGVLSPNGCYFPENWRFLSVAGRERLIEESFQEDAL
ncbi:hypothetical protein KDA11_04855 [Candidatus Saccharibacteria bacterium]|nr:hypothetical protein [Candidatus Saccharibacteria bacterium]